MVGHSSRPYDSVDGPCRAEVEIGEGPSVASVGTGSPLCLPSAFPSSNGPSTLGSHLTVAASQSVYEWTAASNDEALPPPPAPSSSREPLKQRASLILEGGLFGDMGNLLGNSSRSTVPVCSRPSFPLSTHVIAGRHARPKSPHDGGAQHAEGRHYDYQADDADSGEGLRPHVDASLSLGFFHPSKFSSSEERAKEERGSQDTTTGDSGDLGQKEHLQSYLNREGSCDETGTLGDRDGCFASGRRLSRPPPNNVGSLGCTPSRTPVGRYPADTPAEMNPPDDADTKAAGQAAFPQYQGQETMCLFDGQLSKNTHEITLLEPGFYGIVVNHLTEGAWDSLYLGVSRMRILCDYELVMPRPASPTPLATPAVDAPTARAASVASAPARGTPHPVSLAPAENGGSPSSSSTASGGSWTFRNFWTKATAAQPPVSPSLTPQDAAVAAPPSGSPAVQSSQRQCAALNLHVDLPAVAVPAPQALGQSRASDSTLVAAERQEEALGVKSELKHQEPAKVEKRRASEPTSRQTDPDICGPAEPSGDCSSAGSDGDYDGWERAECRNRIEPHGRIVNASSSPCSLTCDATPPPTGSLARGVNGEAVACITSVECIPDVRSAAQCTTSAASLSAPVPVSSPSASAPVLVAGGGKGDDNCGAYVLAPHAEMPCSAQYATDGSASPLTAAAAVRLKRRPSSGVALPAGEPSGSDRPTSTPAAVTDDKEKRGPEAASYADWPRCAAVLPLEDAPVAAPDNYERLPPPALGGDAVNTRPPAGSFYSAPPPDASAGAVDSPAAWERPCVSSPTPLSPATCPHGAAEGLGRCTSSGCRPLYAALHRLQGDYPGYPSGRPGQGPGKTTPESGQGHADEDDGGYGEATQTCKLQASGQLRVRAQGSKFAFVLAPHRNCTIKLVVQTSMALGMKLRCRYELSYGGCPQKIPINPCEPFRYKVSMLSLDGGGVLGLSSLKILERIEHQVRKELGKPHVRLVDCFDMVAGTSTGGLVALGLLAGKTVREMIHLWPSLSGRIFEGNRSLFSGVLFEGYDVGKMKGALIDHLGHKFFGTIPSPYCFVTATDVKHQPYQLFILRNYEHPHAALHSHAYRGSTQFPLWAAGWCTCAAPTYLKGPSAEELQDMGLNLEPKVHLVDGAMLANNPSIICLEEAARLSGKPMGQFIDEDLDLLVAVGTGHVPIRLTQSETTQSASTLQILLNAPHILTSSNSTHREVLHWLAGHDDTYYRFNTPQIGDIPLDSVNPLHLDLIAKATSDYLTDEKFNDVRRIARKLSRRYLLKQRMHGRAA
eukprot:GHVT01070085.1.p1 GENE.GHVT01070085.1~~GHVT01070085.1.p1  ORF type:complete len:1291 (+),score=286.98 GHVT01070085.1:1390-5262(+)